MISSRPEFEEDKDPLSIIPVSFHLTLLPVRENLSKWLRRFPLSFDNSLYHDLTLFYLLATKEFLDHRSPTHLFKLLLSLHIMQKKLLRFSAFSPQTRHIEIRWIPTQLLFPFSQKSVLGCLIGFNLKDRYELFDEENVVLALQKHLPQLQLVKESSYCHTTQHKNFKTFYFEIEKKDGSSFSLLEQGILKSNLEDKVKKSIQFLRPTIFMDLNDEENYKNILILSHEIQSLYDLPQASIHLDQQSGKEIIFRITLVHISPFHPFFLKERFFDCKFVSQRVLTVRSIEHHPIEAHIFRLHLTRDPSLLRSDGALNFYLARQKVVSLMKKAIGEFRDYNGEIFFTLQKLFNRFKENFVEVAQQDAELLETFFYNIVPLEKQIVLSLENLSRLFNFFLENRKLKFSKNSLYTFKIYSEEQQIFLVIQAEDFSITAVIFKMLQEQNFSHLNIVYASITTHNRVFFNCLLQDAGERVERFLQALQDVLKKWEKKVKNQQVLRIGMEYPVLSLDPRIGGEGVSSEVIRLLFEGLTRFHQNGELENGVAESIHISSDLKHYTFKLHTTFWNDGSPVTAYDFEYTWKKNLVIDANTFFAYMFYPIKNAKETKEGKVSSDEVGIYAIDDRTLKIELVRPAPYFLQLIAHPLFSPVNRVMDQQHPQWPYECDKNYLCNGPFQLGMNQLNQGYRLVKNPFYKDIDQIAFDQITFTQMNSGQLLQALEKNEIDWTANPFSSWNPFYTNTEKNKIVSFPNTSVCSYFFNTTSPPFHNQKLRQAFGYAIQRSGIMKECFLPIQSAFSILLPQHCADNQFLFPDFNPAKARELLDEALEELKMKKKQLSLTIIYNEKGIREFVAQQLKKQFYECFGIECLLKGFPWNIFYNRMATGGFQMGIIHLLSWVSDPSYILNNFKFAENGINFSRWENNAFQQLLDRSELETNPFQRSSYLLQAEEILRNEMPIIPIFYQASQSLVKKNLHVVFNQSCGSYNIARSFYKEDL